MKPKVKQEPSGIGRDTVPMPVPLDVFNAFSRFDFQPFSQFGAYASPFGMAIAFTQYHDIMWTDNEDPGYDLNKVLTWVLSNPEKIATCFMYGFEAKR